MNFLSGQIIGEYRLISFIGAGGMGEVYFAEHVRYRRAAVVKILKHLDASGSSWHRFVNEARIQSKLHHLNIATFYAYYDIPKMPCIVMEFVDGLTLDQIISQRGRLPPVHAATFFYTIATTIQYIHEQGIIHRDIKPHNIKISSKGVVKLLDFGISKASFSAPLTAQGQCIGTDNYLAPEQLAGKPASVASDIWALGLLFYEMLTGKKAFEGKALGDLYGSIKTADYPSPTVWAPDVPPALERIIARCLRKSPARRYQNANAICQALQNYFCHIDQPTSQWWRAVIPQENRLLAAGVGALSIVISCILGCFLFNKTEDPSQYTMAEQSPQYLIPSTIQHQTHANSSFSTGNSATMKTVRIDTHGYPAFIYLSTNKFQTETSFTTPYTGEYPAGTRLHFKLKREGYKVCSGNFIVEDSPDANNYMYRMCKDQEPCTSSGCK